MEYQCWLSKYHVFYNPAGELVAFLFDFDSHDTITPLF